MHKRNIAINGARRRVMLPLAAAGVLVLGACQALPPAVSTALVGFGQDVLAAAAQNFTPQYSASMQNLFLAMAETATGMPFTQQDGAGADAPAGYDGMPPSYDAGAYAEGQYEDPYAEDAYAADPYAQDAYAQDPYAQDAYGQDPYAQDPYAQGSYAQDPPAQVAYPPAPYAGAGASPEAQYGAPAGIALEVALLAQALTPDGQVQLRPVQDGDVLRDGRGDPARGDKIKIFFNAGCACYVYVIGIDATGYVAQIFPERGTPASRVQPGADYLVPGGTTWWGLDDYRGIEQVYFIASQERRRDIENSVAQLAGQRPSVPANYRPVRQPAVVPVQRGLVQVQSAAPTSIPTQAGAPQQISPTLFQSTVADADLVITRWFRHE